MSAPRPEPNPAIMSNHPGETPPENYPFSSHGRENVRLLFDFATGMGCFNPASPNRRVLDFACGAGWTSEWLNRMGYDVDGFDCDADSIAMAERRLGFDRRLVASRLRFTTADGHRLPYAAETFGQSFCFDSLHHMADYPAVFQEIFRVLAPGSRAVFVEPGAGHSTSPETVRFLRENPKPDWWIERDVDLLHIDQVATAAGFGRLRVKPFLLPGQVDYSVIDWFHILDNPVGQANHLQEWRRSCWNDRVVFYMDKPE